MSFSILFFFNDTATTEIYTLSLHDALPISPAANFSFARLKRSGSDGSAAKTAMAGNASRNTNESTRTGFMAASLHQLDRKSTRLNSSHSQISYAVFCLKKKKET